MSSCRLTAGTGPALLVPTAGRAGHPVTAEQQERLERLRAAAKVIRDHQAALQAALETDVRVPSGLRATHTLPSPSPSKSTLHFTSTCGSVLPLIKICISCLAAASLALALNTTRFVTPCLWLQAAAVEAQRRAVLRGEVPRDPGHVRMEELRALQQTALTADDEAARFRAAQAVKPVRRRISVTCSRDRPLAVLALIIVWTSSSDMRTAQQHWKLPLAGAGVGRRDGLPRRARPGRHGLQLSAQGQARRPRVDWQQPRGLSRATVASPAAFARQGRVCQRVTMYGAGLWIHAVCRRPHI